MIKKKIITFILLFVVTFQMVLVSRASAEQEKKQVSCIVNWLTIYQSFQEMLDDAVVILEGTVFSQNPYCRDSIVHTNSTIKIETLLLGFLEDEFITIHQYGGETEELITPFLPESPPLRLNCRYLFLLGKTNTEQYYILGAGQGVFEINHEGHLNKSSIEQQFLEHLYNNGLMQSDKDEPMNSRMATPTNGYVYVNNVNVCYSLGSSFTSFEQNAICSGVEEWNYYSSLYLYQGNSFIDITIYTSAWPPDGNTVGFTAFDGARKRYVYIYTDNFDTSQWLLWKKIACHEIGHCIGLGHNNSGLSVMHENIFIQESTPQYNDIITLQALYP